MELIPAHQLAELMLVGCKNTKQSFGHLIELEEKYEIEMDQGAKFSYMKDQMGLSMIGAGKPIKFVAKWAEHVDRSCGIGAIFLGAIELNVDLDLVQASTDQYSTEIVSMNDRDRMTREQIAAYLKNK